MAGDDDDRQAGMEFLDFRQHRQTVHAGQPDIKQDQVGGIFHHLLEGLLARGRHGRQVTFILKDASQGFTDAHFIVNHKNSWFHETIPAIR